MDAVSEGEETSSEEESESESSEEEINSIPVELIVGKKSFGMDRHMFYVYLD